MIPTKEGWEQALIQRHGAALHRKISAARVAVCGLGGLGSNIAIALIELHAHEYDTHTYVINLKELHSHNFDALYAEYSERYRI